MTAAQGTPGTTPSTGRNKTGLQQGAKNLVACLHNILAKHIEPYGILNYRIICDTNLRACRYLKVHNQFRGVRMCGAGKDNFLDSSTISISFSFLFALINNLMICNCQRAGRYLYAIDLTSLSGGNRSPVGEI